MKITVHSLGIEKTVETDTIEAYLWHEGEHKAEFILLLENPRRVERLIVDEPLWLLEEMYGRGK